MKGRGKGADRSVEMPSKADLEDGMQGVKPATPGRMLQISRPEWPWLSFGLLMLLGSLLPGLLLPLAFGRMMDDISDAQASSVEKIRRVDTMATHLVIVLLITAVCTLLRGFIFNAAGERVVARLRIKLFAAIISQEIGLFDKRKTGELLSRLSSDTTSLQDVATSHISMFFRSFVQLVASAALMFFTSWRLSLLIFTVVPIITIGITIYGRVVKKIAIKYSDALGAATDIAQESISNVRTMRAFAAEEVELSKYTRAIGNPDAQHAAGWWWFPAWSDSSTQAVGIRKQMLSSTFLMFVYTVGFGACVLVVWVGARLVIEGYLSVGELVAFMLYAVQIGASIGMMMGLVAQVFVALGASRRTFQLIDRKPQVPIVGGDYPPDAANGHIVFEEVHFAYPSRPDVQVLAGFSLDIPVNATYAFVGSSGAGKSTILALLQRFYNVGAGRILLDGRDICELDPRYLRRAMALVAQEPVLFGSTIAQNITYGGAMDAHDSDSKEVRERVETVAKAAFAHDFITEFPGGYDTLVGERGVRLSGGQKQRVAIARALFVEPRVLLLDEATSALDAASEHFVQKAIDAIMIDRTTLIVAHRLSTVRHADRIVLLDRGIIHAVGPHAELMERAEKYRELVQRQLHHGDEHAKGGAVAADPAQSACAGEAESVSIASVHDL